MRYIVANYSNGYCECNAEDYLAFPDDWTDNDIDKYVDDGLFDYADGYAPSYIEDDDDWDAYFAECEASWVEMTKAEAEEKIGLDNFSNV